MFGADLDTAHGSGGGWVPERLAAKIERKPGAGSFVGVTLFLLIRLEKHDSLLPGTELQGVEQHPVAAHGAFGFDGGGDGIEVLLQRSGGGSAGGKPGA